MRNQTDATALIAYRRSFLNVSVIFNLGEQEINQITARKGELYFALTDITDVQPTLFWFIVEKREPYNSPY